MMILKLGETIDLRLIYALIEELQIPSETLKNSRVIEMKINRGNKKLGMMYKFFERLHNKKPFTSIISVIDEEGNIDFAIGRQEIDKEHFDMLKVAQDLMQESLYSRIKPPKK